MRRNALAPAARINPGRPVRLDGRPYWGSGRLAWNLAEYRERNGFRSWAFCTEWQARQHGCRVPRDQRGICLEHRYVEGGWARFYSADQLEATLGNRTCAEFDFESVAGFPPVRMREDIMATLETIARDLASLREMLRDTSSRFEG